MIRVVLPQHLALLAGVAGELGLDVPHPVTLQSILDALENSYPMLRGTIRDHGTQRRRPMVRFFACEQDITHDPIDKQLPDAIVTGTVPLFIVGAIAGG